MHAEKNMSTWQRIVKFTEVKWAIKTGTAGAIGLYVGSHFGLMLGEEGASTVISGLWCAISAIIIVSQAHLGSSFRAAWSRFLGTAIGATFGSVFTTFLGSDPVSLGVGVALAIIACSSVRLRTGIPLTCATLAFVMILWQLRPELSPWLFALYRFIDACLGVVIAVVVAYVLWPERASKKLHSTMAHIVCLIHKLFLISLEPHPSKKKRTEVHEEIEFSLEKNFVYLQDARHETMINQEKVLAWNKLHRQLHHLFDHVADLQAIKAKEEHSQVEEHIDRMLLELFQMLEAGISPGEIYPPPVIEEQSIYAFVLREILQELVKIRASCDKL